MRSLAWQAHSSEVRGSSKENTLQDLTLYSLWKDEILTSKSYTGAYIFIHVYTGLSLFV